MKKQYAIVEDERGMWKMDITDERYTGEGQMGQFAKDYKKITLLKDRLVAKVTRSNGLKAKVYEGEDGIKYAIFHDFSAGLFEKVEKEDDVLIEYFEEPFTFNFDQSRIMINWWLDPEYIRKQLGIKQSIKQEDWQVLKKFDFGVLAYDYEEGIKIETHEKDLQKCVDFIRKFHKDRNIELDHSYVDDPMVTGNFTNFNANEDHRNEVLKNVGFEKGEIWYVLTDKSADVVYNKSSNKQEESVMKKSDLTKLTNKALNDVLGNKYTATQMKKVKKEQLVDEIMKSESRPGVVGTIIITLFSGFVSKDQIMKTLKVRFPNRTEEKMGATLNAQLYRLRSKYNIEKNSVGEFRIA